MDLKTSIKHPSEIEQKKGLTNVSLAKKNEACQQHRVGEREGERIEIIT